jgi:hypothetical protein
VLRVLDGGLLHPAQRVVDAVGAQRHLAAEIVLRVTRSQSYDFLV